MADINYLKYRLYGDHSLECIEEAKIVETEHRIHRLAIAHDLDLADEVLGFIVFERADGVIIGPLPLLPYGAPGKERGHFIDLTDTITAVPGVLAFGVSFETWEYDSQDPRVITRKKRYPVIKAVTYVYDANQQEDSFTAELSRRLAKLEVGLTGKIEAVLEAAFIQLQKQHPEIVMSPLEPEEEQVLWIKPK